MRIIDTTAGIPIVVSDYEKSVLTKCQEWIDEKTLGEFDHNIADRLVSKGLMERTGTKYRSIKVNKLWRI